MAENLEAKQAEWGKRMIEIRVRLWTDKIAEGKGLGVLGAKREHDEFEQTTETPVEKGQQGELMGLGLHGRKLRHPTRV